MIADYTFLLSVLIVFLLGICIGSFLNVCIYRIPIGKSIVSPPSSCPGCQKLIPFYCNIPIISFLILKGRCKFCGARISTRYPLIECFTGILGVLLLLKFGLTGQMAFWFVFMSVLLTISFIDLDHQIIPDAISLPGILIFASSFYFVPEMTLKNTLVGILLGGGSLSAVAAGYYLLRRQEGMGVGDIKLLAMIGAATGVKGVFFTIFSGSLIGTIVGMIMILRNRGSSMRLKIPFGPYLSMGAILYVFWGERIIFWYLGLLAM